MGRCDHTDHSKLDVRDGGIYCQMYRQDGTMQTMCFVDTPFNRDMVAWMKIHDRYGDALPDKEDVR